MQNRLSFSPANAATFTHIGPATRAMVQIRTHELAVRAGRTAPHVTQFDYEQAKREITGESDLDRQNDILDSNLLLGPSKAAGPATAEPIGHSDPIGGRPSRITDSVSA